MPRSSLIKIFWLSVWSLGLFVSADGNAQGNDNDPSCTTPAGESSTCVPLMQCQHMVNLIKSLARPILPEISKKITEYTCGSSGGGPKVCCPSSPIDLGPTLSSRYQKQPEQPPDVTNHPNIKLLPKTCGYLDTSVRIVNGNDSALNEFPWMALLQYRSPKNNNALEFLCGGTVINKNYILTAAHCIEDSQQLVSIRVGEYSIANETDCQNESSKKIKCNPPVQDLTVEKIIRHPLYGGKPKGFVNDIGLIRVSTINLEVENARPVCLPLGIVRDTPFKRVIITGWGVTNPWTGKTADILQKVGLPVFDKEQCTKTYNDAGIALTPSQICAGGVDRDSCGGDSGGPLLVPTPVGEDFNLVYVQQGVVSFGPRICANPEYPGIYTAVKYYMDWILDTMKE